MNTLSRTTILLMVAALMCAALALGSGRVASAPVASGVIVEPELLAQMRQQGQAGYMIFLSARPDLSAAYEMDWAERGRHVVGALQQTAARSQAKVRDYLERRGIDYLAFWIDNIIVVESSDPATLDGLMGFSEIQSLRALRTMSLIEPMPGQERVIPTSVEPNLSHIKADQVWETGIDGTGMVVANIDSGVRYTHDTLAPHYRGNLGGGAFDHDHSWLSPADGDAAPTDEHGHGTHTMGTMIGDDGTNQIGMAPGAEWIACDGCTDGACPGAALLTCAQWIAAPYPIGDPGSADADRRPQVVNNSWGDCGTSYSSWFQASVDSWLAAGIYPVFSNGNASNCSYSYPPGLNTVGNPARYANVTAVGSTGLNDGEYATHSNWGPTDREDTLNPRGYPNLKPQVVAPGVNIRSSYAGSDSHYASSSGTSMSAPHVAGLVALMWQAAPCLLGDYATTETIIEQTACPIAYETGNGDEGPGNVPNHATGWGEIDALTAVQEAAGRCEGTVHLNKEALQTARGPGESITYTLSISATGVGAVGSVIPTDTLPAEQRVLASAASAGDCYTIAAPIWGGGITCTLGSLQVGSTARVTLTAEVTTTAPAELPHLMRNSAQAAGAQGSSTDTADVYLHNCYARINDDPEQYTSVQEAVNQAGSGDTVKIAGSCSEVHEYGGSRQVVHILNDVNLQGGYGPDSWNTPDPAAHPTVLDAKGNGRVIRIGGGMSPIVEGLRITGGDATGQGGGPDGGDAGGGIYVQYASVTIRDCAIYANEAPDEGGGAYVESAGAVLNANAFTGNSADRGAGLFLSHSSATVSGNVLSLGSATDGGGVYLSHSDATLTLNTISSNSATNGAGMYLYFSDPALTANELLRNTALEQGGGLSLWYSHPALINNILAANQAGGAGVGLYIHGSSPDLLHTTIAGNGSGQGVAVTSLGTNQSNPTLANTILVGHAAGISVTAGNTAVLEGTLWGSGTWANGQDWTGEGTIATGAANVWGDPAFFYSAGGNYHLGPGSAAIDTGIEAGISSDIDGQPRPIWNGYDMGADEALPGMIVDPATGGTLIYTDTHGHRTIIEAPAGSVDETIALIYTPLERVTAPAYYHEVGHAFDLSAYRNDTLLPGFIFDLPIHVTIHYSATRVTGLDENQLILMYWDAGAGEWQEGACGAYMRSPGANWLTIPFCHVGRFALLGMIRVQALFTASPTRGLAPLAVSFANASTGSSLSSRWDLGDGVTSTLASPAHTYTATGSFTVSLTVTGPAGSDTLSVPDRITVVEPAWLFFPTVLRN